MTKKKNFDLDADGPAELLPYRALYCAMLERAIRDYLGQDVLTEGVLMTEGRSRAAGRWLRDRRIWCSDEGVSSAWICQQLDLDHARLVRAVERLRSRAMNLSCHRRVEACLGRPV